MKTNKIFTKLNNIVLTSDFCILYRPLSSEIDPSTLPFNLPALRFVVPSNAATNPKLIGKIVTERFYNKKGIILIPGRKFDKFGGRHGKGLGWYDRFLSVIPTNWIRIGICSDSEFSDTELILQDWDEVMDWVVVRNGTGFSYYETNSRNL